MEIKDIQSGQGKIDVTFEIASLDEPKEFNKFGKEGKLVKGKAKDPSGEISVTFWNEQVDKVSVGAKVKITNGWCSEYQGEKQLSTGKFGQLEVLGGDTPATE